MLTRWRGRLRDATCRVAARGEAGGSLVEYTFLLALVGLVAFAALTFVGHATANSLNISGSSLFVP
jgi:Flp pilus assembly pilin Flp